MSSLFEPPDPSEAELRAGAPLAARMRPRTLEEYVGQEHLLHDGSALRTAIEQGRPHSMILYGPPGAGKTTLARIVASSADAVFEELSAVQVGRPEVRAVIERAEQRRRMGRQTIFFLDEIHRFNKAQQDALLPAVEDGRLTLIGATTENPSYEVNGALLSRARLYALRELTEDHVLTLLRRAVERRECGLVSVDDDALELLAARSGGDARTALAALELACDTAPESKVTLEHAEDALQRRILHYDRASDHHYDTISAWIKATRGSDPDASLYYLAVMLEGGEDPRFIARRMVILASEDIGNADPQALVVAVAAADAVQLIGLPEGAHALAQAAVYLSLAPKSNAAYKALGAARQHVRDRGAAPPPVPLRSGGRGDGYDYPHDRPGHVSPQELLPDSVAGTRFWRPTATERALGERLERIRRARGRQP
ncbi:replication-associated recombination protein A [Conexibacter woesei]|uniref:AAA ATPase central domain protein n=1 Tax=Conexibacter woesei (strain DSM 14684 / CCUG 47730 / CIP 108061 / JCM 11494 / NBRC 100937 / ID131577) TaxID=469383 RepID=D3F2Y7_CONWI|nr:replication-associated recombination protein A [Conexibacter woesei]ADB54268.1 AAA ATPase central domain protein [Conexibacter woesei DSM 14684]